MRGRIMRSFGADAFGQMISVGMRLMLVPLFLSVWGAESYGEWLILTAVAAWFNLGDLGAQLYFVNRMTADWAAGKRQDFQRAYSTGLLFLGVASLIVVGVVILIVFLFPLSSWFELSSVDMETAKAVLLLMAFRFSISLPVGLWMGIYRAIGMQATSVMYGNLILIIQFVACACALAGGGGMLLLAALEVLPFLLLIPILAWDLKRRMPTEFSLTDLTKAQRSIMISAISPSLHFLSLQFSAALMIQGSILIFARVLGPVEVAVFSSMRIIANVMTRFIGMISHAAWPEITRLASLCEEARLSQLFRAVLSTCLFIGLLYFLVVLNFGEYLYLRWLGGVLPYEPSVMLLLSANVVLSAMWGWGGNLLMATNRHESYSRWQVLVTFVSIFLGYIGCLSHELLGGVIGLVLGQYFPMLAITVWQLTRNRLSRSARDLAVSSGLCMLILVVIYYTFYLF